MKKIFYSVGKKTLFYLLFLFGNLLIANFILSFFDPEQVMVKSYDSNNLFVMYPNKSGQVVSEEYNIEVRTNSYGFRQALLPMDNYNSIVLGDSFTEGWGVQEADTFVSIANSELPSGNKLLNLGIHGASPAFYALQLKNHIDTFKPKIAFVQLFDNDLDDNEKLTRFMILQNDGKIQGPKPDLSVRILGEYISNGIKESTLYRLGKRIVAAIKKQPNTILYYKPGHAPKIEQLSHSESLKKYGSIEPLAEDISIKYGSQFEFYSNKNSDIWTKRLQDNNIYLNQILDICKQNKVELRIIYVPAKEFYAKDGITGKLVNSSLKEKLANNPHANQIFQFCKTNSLICYNTAEVFYSNQPDNLYFPYDAHWNSQGHLIFGKYLSNSLKKEYK